MKNQKGKKLLYSIGLLFSSIYSINKFAKYFDFDGLKNDLIKKNQKHDEGKFDNINERILKEIKNISELRYNELKEINKTTNKDLNTAVDVTDNFSSYVQGVLSDELNEDKIIYDEYLKDLSDKQKLDEYIKKEQQKKEQKQTKKHQEAFKQFDTTYSLDDFSDEEIKLLQKVWYEDNVENNIDTNIKNNITPEPVLEKNINLNLNKNFNKEDARTKINQIFKLSPNDYQKEVTNNNIAQEIKLDEIKNSIEDVLKTSNFSDDKHVEILEDKNNNLDNLVSNILSKDGYVNLKELAFKTPEESIIKLFKAIREENIISALQCFSTTSFVDNIDFLKNITANEWTYFPSEYDFFYKTNWIQTINQKSNYILSFITNLLLEENQLITGMGKPKYKIDITEQDAFDIFKSLDTSKLNSLNIKSIDVPNPALMNIKETKKVLQNEAIIDGALDKTERVVLFEYNNNMYFSCFTLIKYQEGWKVERFGAKFSLNTPLDFNSAYRVNNQEYYALTV